MSKDGEERLVFDVPASWRRVSDAHRRACTCGRVAFFFLSSSSYRVSIVPTRTICYPVPTRWSDTELKQLTSYRFEIQ